MNKKTTLHKNTRISTELDPLNLPDWSAFRPEIALQKLRKLYAEERAIINNKLSSRHTTHGEIFYLRAPTRRKIIALLGELYHFERVAKHRHPGITDAVRTASLIIEKHSQFVTLRSKYPQIVNRLSRSALSTKLSPSERWYLSREARELGSPHRAHGKKLNALSSTRIELDTQEKVFAEKNEINDTAVLRMVSLRSKIAQLSGFSSWNEKVLRGLMMSHIGVSGVSTLFAGFKKQVTIWHVQKLKNYRVAFFAPRYTEDGVLEAVKEILRIHFSITLEAHDTSVWAKDVLFFRAHDKNGTLLGGLYVDLYVRKGKIGGAWSGAVRDGEKGILPLAMVVTNFTQGKRIAHYEFLTLVHEVGHAVHYLCARPDSYLGYVRYLEDDAVEIAGRFFERFAFDTTIVERALLGKKKTLSVTDSTFIAKLPEYRRAYLTHDRSLDVAVSEFDWEIHLHPPKNSEDLHVKWREIYNQIIPDTKEDGSVFPSVLRYVFDGRYSAKFLLYIWADIVAAQLYQKYQNIRKKSPKKASAMLSKIFQKGSSAPMMNTLRPFIGSRVRIDAYIHELARNIEDQK